MSRTTQSPSRSDTERAPSMLLWALEAATWTELGAKVAITARRADELAEAQAEDLKGVTALQASDACTFSTGQIIAVDGGPTPAF